MIADQLKSLIDYAERLGGFSSAAVWAFFCVIFLLYIFWDLRGKGKASTLAWTARLEEAKADMLLANALDKLSEEIRDMAKDKSSGGTHV